MSDPEPSAAKPPRILLVDDNDAIRTVLHRLLARSGFDVVEARNGVEALAAHKARPADIVVTDLIMPEKEGLETILELRRMQPRLRIIAMSGGGRVRAQDYLKLASALGASRTLAKPFSEAELLKAIQELLDGD
ncbi:MAG: response regulator [Verrucomicrobiales bacterium]|nr:response regulator [Verrucomicrobiales bacterium]